jgi:hypothetical protein
MSEGFNFQMPGGGNPGDGSGGNGQTPEEIAEMLRRQMQQIQELEDRLNRVTLDNRQLRNDLEAANLRRDQTEQLLGDVTAPTIFNQIQVNK